MENKIFFQPHMCKHTFVPLHSFYLTALITDTNIQQMQINIFSNTLHLVD